MAFAVSLGAIAHPLAIDNDFIWRAVPLNRPPVLTNLRGGRWAWRWSWWGMQRWW